VIRKIETTAPKSAPWVTNINKYYLFAINIDNSSGLRNRDVWVKETFPGDYSYLRVPTDGWMIPEGFPHKISIVLFERVEKAGYLVKSNSFNFIDGVKDVDA
jgi:hypothetical protein